MLLRPAFLAALFFLPGAGLAAEGIHDAFAPRAYAATDLALLALALEAEGDLDADGIGWDGEAGAALAAFALRRFGDPEPRGLHAAALAQGFEARLAAEGWRRVALPGFQATLALPLPLFGDAQPEEDGLRRWSLDGAATVLVHHFTESGMRHWHSAAARAHAGPEPVIETSGAQGRTTAGQLADGRGFITRSIPIGADWVTVYAAADPEAAGLLPLLAAGLAASAPTDPDQAVWPVAPDGRLARDMAAADRLARALVPTPVPMPTSARPPEAGAPAATGTGFYVSDRVLLTADHVVRGCTRVALSDGTEIAALAADPDLDLAAFRVPDPAPVWFDLARDAAPRLGQRVSAAGFPYFSIVGTALNLTGGNVSALTGVDDDTRFFAFTAPVQPGNSGGPLIDGRGRVTGLVVSRLSEQFIIEETGSLPQNMNFALKPTEIREFLSKSGVVLPDGGGAVFDLDAGAPPEITAAVVPVICD